MELFVKNLISGTEILTEQAARLIKKINGNDKSHLMKEDGFPTKHGLEVFKKLEDTLAELFSSQEVMDLNISQTRTMGAYLAKIVGDAVSANLNFKNTVKNISNKIKI